MGGAIGHVVCHAEEAWTNALLDVFLNVTNGYGIEQLYVNTTARWYTEKTWSTWGKIMWVNQIKVLNPYSHRYRDKYYEGIHSNNAMVNTSTSELFACYGDRLVIDMTAEHALCEGDTYLRLYLDGSEVAENDDYDHGLCSTIYYDVTSSGCHNFTLSKGCYGSGACSGAPIISGPSSHWQLISEYFDSFFEASFTDSARSNVATSEIFACYGDQIEIELSRDDGHCEGDTYLRLYLDDKEVAKDDDSGQGVCSKLSYRVTSTCRNYTLAKGCYSNDACSGTPEIFIFRDIKSDYYSYYAYVDSNATIYYGNNNYLLDMLMSVSKFDDLLDRTYVYAEGQYMGKDLYDW